jgi:hypothetical protein
MNNQCLELTKENSTSLRAGSLVSVLIEGQEIKGVLGLYDNTRGSWGVSDILTSNEVKGVLFHLGGYKLCEPNESFEWYQHNREDIFSRLKLLGKI